jgi:prepilin-type N-terminal cleavage/methylation domain-containing protein
MKQQKRSGFTIIEVVLVLAIAGLIFLMVFVALPALQRSQRDTARKNIYSGIGAAVTTYRSNNNGALPTGRGDKVCTIARGAGDVTMTNTSRCTKDNTSRTTPATFTSGGISYSLWVSKLSTDGDWTFNTGTNFTYPGIVKNASDATLNDTNKIVIVTNAICDTVNSTGANKGTVALKYSYGRSVVMGYVESGETVTCLEVD